MIIVINYLILAKKRTKDGGPSSCIIDDIISYLGEDYKLCVMSPLLLMLAGGIARINSLILYAASESVTFLLSCLTGLFIPKFPAGKSITSFALKKLPFINCCLVKPISFNVRSSSIINASLVLEIAIFSKAADINLLAFTKNVFSIVLFTFLFKFTEDYSFNNYFIQN